jgi:HAD superfamily hydrolase (TIGR01509 family)
MYKAVIFDVDGTLVDSNDAHASAWADAFAESGRTVAFERVRPLIGMGGDKLLAAAAGISADSDEGRRIASRRREIFQQRYLSSVRPTPGGKELVTWLRDEQMTVVVATSADPDELQELLRIAGVRKLIEDTTSSRDASRSKPDPDIVHAALVRTGCRPQGAVMIGDTPYDIEAAGRSGIGTIAVRCGGWPDEALRAAIAIYDDPADLLERYALSPFMRPLPV